MNKSGERLGQADFKKMKECLDQIEGQLNTLNSLGKGMPVIEKNVRALWSFVHALKFGVSDIAELEQ
jgi:hypothetical protein